MATQGDDKITFTWITGSVSLPQMTGRWTQDDDGRLAPVMTDKVWYDHDGREVRRESGKPIVSMWWV